MRSFCSLAILFSVVLFASDCFAEGQKSQPNVIVILGDDMGYSDIGCYGGEINTPHLDQLAENGVRFTQFYNTARCCPTRASLLTGLYPHQAGVGHMTYQAREDLHAYQGQLNKRCATIAEVLKPAGYRTYMSGKWHVTRDIAPDGPKDVWPLQRGFEKFYGTITGAGSFYDPTCLCRGNTYITPENDSEYQPETFYYTDAISDNAVTFLKDHKKETPEKPFFLYLPYTTAHWPMHALPQDIAKYKGKYDDGYEAIRKARLEKMKSLGLLSKNWKLPEIVGDWNSVNHKEWEIAQMEVYAAMIDSMDQGIGRVLNQLKASGDYDNTLVLFMQDNGGCAEGVGRRSNAVQIKDLQLKPLGKNGLQTRVTPPMQTRDGRAVRTGPEVMPGPEDTYIAYGKNWANVSNTPFREYKHWVHEGGISTPLIAHWPAGINSKIKGTWNHTNSHLIDIMATVVDVSGAKYPAKPIQPVEGISLNPAFKSSGIVPRSQPIFWEHEGNRALRDGDFKLVAKGQKGKWELYNIKTDRTEMHDISAQHPDKKSKMIGQWKTWANRVGVVPFRSWGGKKNNKKNNKKKKQKK